MKVHHTLICVFLTALQDFKTGVVTAESRVYTGTEGGNITVGCLFNFSGRKRLFCKKECTEENILVQTTKDRGQRGRYSIEYKVGTFPAYSPIIYVSITQLTKADSGWYMCHLERSGFVDGYEEFEIIVASEPNPTVRPVSPSLPSASTPTATTQSLSSSSGSFTPSSASPGTSRQPETSPTSGSHTPNEHSATRTVLLSAGLILVFMIIVLSAAVLIFCRKRAGTPKGHPVETVYANVTEANRVYDEIREEDRRSRSPPVEMSVCTNVQYVKGNRDETTDEYSLATASCAPSKAEDDASKLDYSEVNFSKGAAASRNSAPSGNTETVYSEVQAKAPPSPLYSTVHFT